jgi:hypothetical protein
MCLSFLLIHSFLSGQNLVPNPSFEDTIACPTTANQLNNCAFWSVVNNTPDYFHECDFITGNTSVPYNFAGFQFASSGNAYVGLFTFSRVQPNEREIITCELISPMVIGQKYLASMKISWSGANATIASNKTGMLFSTQLFSPGSVYPVTNMSHIYSNVIDSDSINWTTISGSIIADSNYQYLLIGNFFDDINTDTAQFHPLTSYAYYYIDDVSVIPDTLNSLNHIYSNVGVNVFPNPTSDYLNVSIDHTDINILELYDMKIRLIRTISNINNRDILINLDEFSPGIYLLKIISTSSIKTVKIILT